MEATDKEPSILLQGSPFPLGELQVRWKYVDIHVRNTGNTYVHEKKTYVNLYESQFGLQFSQLLQLINLDR